MLLIICFIYSFAFNLFQFHFLMLEGVRYVFELCVHVPRLMKFTAFMDESVEKINQYLAHKGV